MLSLFDIKRVLNPPKTNMPTDDFRIIQSWAEYDEDSSKTPEQRNLEYLCYEFETMDPRTGAQYRLYKAIKFARVIRLPANAKQSTAFMDMQQQVLAGVYEGNFNFITVIANIIKPVPQGLLYLYGIQGVSEDLEEAKEIAHQDFLGFIGMMQGTFRVLEMKCVEAQETEWLREKMYNMDYMTVVRGIPKANKAGEDAGNRGVGGNNINPDSQGTLEEIITGMSDYEYVIEILSTPVYMDTLRGWQRQSQKEMTDWYGQLQGTKSLSFNMSIPMMYGTSAGASQGWSKGYTDSSTTSTSTGESYTSTEGQSINQSFGQSVGHTTGTSVSQSESYGTSHTVGNSQGFGINHSVSSGENMSVGTNQGTSTNQSHGSNLGVSSNESSGFNQGVSTGFNQSTNASQSQSASQGTSYGVSAGQTTGTSHNVGNSTNYGFNQSQSVSQGNTASLSQSASGSTSIGTNSSSSYGQNSSLSQGSSYSDSYSGSNSSNSGFNVSILGNGISISGGSGTSHSVSNGDSITASSGNSYTNSNGASASSSISNSNGTSLGASLSSSLSYGNSFSQGVSESYGTSNSQSLSESFGANTSTSNSYSIGNSAGTSYGESAGLSSSYGTGQSAGISSSYGTGTSTGTSQSYGVNQSTSDGYSQNYSSSESYGESMTLGQSVGQSVSDSTTNSTSTGYGQSESVSIGNSNSTSNGTSNGRSTGTSGTTTSGTSSSMGLSPSIGYSKSYQWMDQGVKDLLEMMEFQNNRIKEALRGEGAFYTYCYIACPNMDALSTAKALAKSTWQNEYAMTSPLQVLDITESEQKHLLYHFAGFSADVTREDVFGVEDYKYCTVLLPKEFVSYTHLPRVSEGGVFSIVQDIPKFSVPSMMKGEIYMGTILNPERFTFKNGYRTPFDYRIDESSLLHGYFTGASRSGKTVAAMRFVAELSQVRRKKTGKRLRIVAMDPKKDWRTLARFVEPERFNFYSLGNLNFHPIKINPWKIPKGVWPQLWIDGVIDIYCRSYGLLERGKQMIADVVFELYEEAGVFEACDKPDWEETTPALSANVNFHSIYQRMEDKRDQFAQAGRSGNDTKDAYARLLERLSCFAREFSVECKLYGTSEGIGIDELIGDDDVTVLESKGLENTFKNFIFGVITSGFYKFALSHEDGYLAEDQYETVLVIEEANEILTGNDAAGSGGGQQVSLSGQSEFEQMLDQAAGYGLFVFSITQKIADMPSSIIANCGIVFAGRLKRPDDINTVVRAVGREERIDDRDLVKWFPRSPTGYFVCQTSRTFDFKDAEPILVQISQLNINPPSNAELDDILVNKELNRMLKQNSIA